MNNIEFTNYLEKIDNENDLKSIDILYEYLEKILEKDDFYRVIDLIELVINKQFSLRLLFAMLTITYSQKNNIYNRQKIINIIKQKNNLTKNQINNLLKGF